MLHEPKFWVLALALAALFGEGFNLVLTTGRRALGVCVMGVALLGFGLLYFEWPESKSSPATTTAIKTSGGGAGGSYAGGGGGGAGAPGGNGGTYIEKQYNYNNPTAAPSQSNAKQGYAAPTFSEVPQFVTLVFGNDTFNILTTQLSSPREVVGEHGMLTASIGPIVLQILNGHLYVSATVTTPDGSSIRIARNMITNEPPTLDRNYNDDAMEFSTQGGTPVFQLIIKASAQIIINGMFRSRKGNLFVASEHGVAMNPDPAHMPSLTPIFKHPRWKYPGQYAQP